MDEAAPEDESLAAAEAPMPAYLATDSEDSDEDKNYMPTEPTFTLHRAHDDEAGTSLSG